LATPTEKNPDIQKFSVSLQLVGLDFYRFSVFVVTVLRPFRQLVHGNLEKPPMACPDHSSHTWNNGRVASAQRGRGGI
jgi:hypothetical protein